MLKTALWNHRSARALLSALILGFVLNACGGDDKKNAQNPPPPTALAGVSVSNANVRSCDISLTLAAGVQLSGVEFADRVRGVYDAWPPKAALAFNLRADQAPSGTLAILSVANAGSAAAVQVATATCYDASGQTVSDPGLGLN